MFQPSDPPVEASTLTPPPAGLVARALADQYIRCLSDYWHGGVDRMSFELWLAAYWRPEPRARPDRMADATSPHGAGGRGIDWYETPAAVYGHVDGVDGGYEIPVDAIRRALPRFEREHAEAAARDPIGVVD